MPGAARVEPLTELERKASFHSITLQQLHAVLGREEEQLKALKEKATTPADRTQLKSARLAFNKKKKQVYDQEVNAMRAFNTTTAEACELADKLGKQQVKDIVVQAYRSSPYSD